MKYMNWSWHDYISTPASIVNEVIDIMKEEQEELELQRMMHQ